MLCIFTDLFFKINFFKKIFQQQTVWIQIGADVLSVLIWIQRSVGPDLGLNCLQKLSADQTRGPEGPEALT